MASKFQKLFSMEKLTLQNDSMCVGDHLVMHRWETPLMKRMAKIVAGKDKDVLEIGFGMGISADFIQQFGCKSHTLLEIHPEIYKLGEHWAKNKNAKIIQIDAGLFPRLYPERFDSILLDAFPVIDPSFFSLIYSGNMKKNTVLVPFGIFDEKHIENAYPETELFFKKCSIEKVSHEEFKAHSVYGNKDLFFKVFSGPRDEILRIKK
ncbi:class I SAM-dependent methyltransferase [Candidatus Woesearchaeota archaeon]|nr:class I SAM-dependent methyltransferase [Candidatus Woesearchaeota archaeon]